MGERREGDDCLAVGVVLMGAVAAHHTAKPEVCQRSRAAWRLGATETRRVGRSVQLESTQNKLWVDRRQVQDLPSRVTCAKLSSSRAF